jgi:hypothetical protein
MLVSSWIYNFRCLKENFMVTFILIDGLQMLPDSIRFLSFIVKDCSDDLAFRIIETERFVASALIRCVEFVKSIDTKASIISSRDSRRE